MGHNLLWVTLGNTISGALFMGAAYWFASRQPKETKAADISIGEVVKV
jgi:nitrite transporter NirC